jgi:aspartyl-tRNA synthetase
MVFFNLRQRTDSIQALIVASPKVSKPMVKWAGAIADESIVLVEGVVQLPKEEVKSASVSNVEILISQVRRIDNAIFKSNESPRSSASSTSWLIQNRG